ncbi:hypothetical protein XENOCAPTIV_030824 [Xenoophorus captivus]|uniref:Uncharacterized protein n=1 Tax=Xenoophorus captivus TaxID=1517983 RepID=A0ABV0QG63_9TELE
MSIFYSRANYFVLVHMMHDIFQILNKSFLPCCHRLKPQNTEKVLQDYGNRARKLEGQKLALGDFAHFLDVPVSDMLRDMFALFDETCQNSGNDEIGLQEKFRGFVEENPDFADDYLHTESVVPQRGPGHDHDTQTNPSTINLQGTANSKTANGICPDFSPKDHDGTVNALMKKHN